MGSQASEGFILCSNRISSEHTSQLIWSCLIVKVGMWDIVVPCLLDTWSMVTTITEGFFKQYFQSQGVEQLQQCNWLQLKADNGLEIPYVGYIELDVNVLGKTLPKMGVLVIKDSFN